MDKRQEMGPVGARSVVHVHKRGVGGCLVELKKGDVGPMDAIARVSSAVRNSKADTREREHLVNISLTSRPKISAKVRTSATEWNRVQHVGTLRTSRHRVEQLGVVPTLRQSVTTLNRSNRVRQSRTEDDWYRTNTMVDDFTHVASMYPLQFKSSPPSQR